MAALPLVQDAVEVEDVLSDALEGLYGYTPISHSSAGSQFCYSMSAEQLCLQASVTDCPSMPTISLITPATESKNWSLHASSIWNSSLFLADHLHELHLDKHISTVRGDGRDKLRVLELGAGAGLPSILVSRCYNDVDVFVSDYPDNALIRSLQVNVEVNGVSKKCRVAPYAWGEASFAFVHGSGDILSEGKGHMDVILAADTLWNSQTHLNFLSSLQMLLRKTEDARIYLVSGLHTGRYTLQAFMLLVEGTELEFEEVMERNVTKDIRREWQVGRDEGEDFERERRQWAVWMKIRWQRSVLHS